MKNIVIVEQNRLYAEMLKKLFRDHYNVTIYSRGMTFLDDLKSLKPDILLVNYALPDIFGLQVLKKFRERFKSVPVIVHDVESDYAVAKRAIDEGADDYVVQDENCEHRLYQSMHKLLSRARRPLQRKKVNINLGFASFAILLWI